MKKKIRNIAVTYGATWWKEDGEEGKPQGTHKPEQVISYESLSVLAAALMRASRDLDEDLPLAIAKTHQPYVVWAALDMHGDCRRKEYNVLPSRLLPFDLDGVSPDAWKSLKRALSPYEYLYYFTASDSAESRRVRLVLLADTMLPRVKEACLRFEQLIMSGMGASLERSTWSVTGAGTVKFDRSMSDPAHFAFLPPGDNKVYHHEGASVVISELPELEQDMQHAVKTQHHNKDHAKRMREFAKAPEENMRLIAEYLDTTLAAAANTNARSDGTYGWGRICGALSDFIGTEWEDWARELLVSWSMKHGREWANEAGIDEYDWDQSIRDEFGKWTNPYKTIFTLVGNVRKDERAAFIESLNDDELADDEPEERPAPRKLKKLPPKIAKKAAELPPVPAVSAFRPYGAKLQAEFDQKGDIISTFTCAENVRWVLDQRKAQVCINDMTGEMELFFSSGRVVSDYDVIISELTDLATFHRIPTSTIERHIRRIALERSYHPVAAALHGKEWDGEERVLEALRCFNFDDPDYAIPVMRKWLLSAVAAVLLPEHFEAKLVPILVGRQSSFKSNAISRFAGLVPRQFHDEQIDLKEKDSLIRAVGSHIVEWAEMGNLHKADVDKVKSFLSRKIDSYRPAYARASTRKQRRSVFIGTANPGGRPLLADKTGNIRFAVLPLKTVDIDRLNELLGWEYYNGRLQFKDPGRLEQFWLEVKSWYDGGESWHVTGALRDKQEDVNEEFTAEDPIEEAILSFMEQHADCEMAWKKSGEIAKEIGIQIGQSQLVGYALKRLFMLGKVEMKKYQGLKNTNRYLWPLPGSTPDNELSD